MRASGRLFLLLMLLGPPAAWGQPSSMNGEGGIPFFFEHYTPQDYHQYYQNWGIAQDPRGLIYVANNDGILEYDGASWRLIELPAKTVVRSLDVDARGVVYVGLKGDFGYLRPDSTGTLVFASLRDHLDPEARDVKDVWGTHAAREGGFFQSYDRLYRWDGHGIKVWEGEKTFHTSFAVHNQFYVRQDKLGLMRVAGDVLEQAPGGAHFAGLRIYMMVPYGDDRVLIGTREAGFFLYDGVSAAAFPTDIDAFLRDYRLYHGTALPGGRFAVATLDGGGVFIINDQGRLVRRLDTASGVEDWINFLYTDRQGGLWMALDNQGILRVDVPTQLSVFDRRRGLEGIITGITRHQGRLYVATGTGLYVLEAPAAATGSADTPAAFKSILKKTSLAIHSADSVLFVGTDGGLYAMRAAQRVDVITTGLITSILESRRWKGELFLGTADGLARLVHTPAGWRVTERQLGGIKTEVHSIEEAMDGTLWVATTDRKVARLRFSDGAASPAVDRFDQDDGVPEDILRLTAVEGEVVLTSAKGIFRFTEKQGAHFNRDMVLSPQVEAASDSLLHVFSEPAGALWTVYPDRVEVATRQDDGSYVRAVPPVLRFPKAKSVRVFVEEGGIAWIGNGDRLIRYDPHGPKRYDAAFSALVRKITSAETGRVLYGGAPLDAEAAALVLENKHHDLHFDVGAPSFNDPAATQYQFFLEGKDEAWTDWAPLASKPYTRLKPGVYTFRVRARNAQWTISREAAFTFRLLPPWYLTWWAFSLYVITLAAILALLRHYYQVVQENKRARAQARELARERHVNERLQQANRRLQEANDSLKQVNKLKDEFLANTSHELRTPLTAIIGFSAVLKEELPAPYHEFLNPIESNGQRLLHTVNSLLDIAKLRAGMMEVHREEVNLGEEVAAMVRALAPLAHRKNLLLELVQPPHPIYAHLDLNLLERILYNLIGNAIKFTRVGEVRVMIEQQGSRVRVLVGDTGIGIDPDFIPHLFDEFKQESTGFARLHEGNGLGLAITARLIKLMEGEIAVRSEKGKGSTFTVSFPAPVPCAEAPVHETSTMA